MRKRRESVFNEQPLGSLWGIALCLGVVFLVNVSRANNGIYRSSPLPTPLFSTDEELPGGLLYSFNQDIFPAERAIAHSGSSSTEDDVPHPEVFQHVYAYSKPDAQTVYRTSNTYQYAYTSVIESATPRQSGRKIVIRDSFTLGGSILLGTDPEMKVGYRDLLANLDINITITDEQTGKTRRIFTGSAGLFGKNKGGLKFRGRGNVKGKLFNVAEKSAERVTLEFRDIEIPYKAVVRFDAPYTIKTEVVSRVENHGAGTGAEVVFFSNLLPAQLESSSEPVVPEFMEGGPVPEPSSLLLLAAGALGAGRSLRKRRYR